MTETLTKPDAIDIMLRPFGDIDQSIKERMSEKLIKLDQEDFTKQFKYATNLTLMHIGGNHFLIKY